MTIGGKTRDLICYFARLVCHIFRCEILFLSDHTSYQTCKHYFHIGNKLGSATWQTAAVKVTKPTSTTTILPSNFSRTNLLVLNSKQQIIHITQTQTTSIIIQEASTHSRSNLSLALCPYTNTTVNAKLSYAIPKMAVLETIPTLKDSTSFLDTSTIIALTVFFTLLCLCIIIGHLLEEHRWANESITALLLVSQVVPFNYDTKFWVLCFSNLLYLQGLVAGVVVLLVTQFESSQILVFNEDLFFLYLLPPIIFNAGYELDLNSMQFQFQISNFIGD